MSGDRGKISPRPYARLITMMGEQLIRNEKIALLELIKNSYDADASWVQIRFLNFRESENDLQASADSAIEIEDDGIGMTFDIIRDSWMNPASPYKYIKKKMGQGRTEKGRIMQGEKGIGRFAAFKLGSTVEIVTRSEQKGSPEVYLKSDLALFDEELISRKGDLSNKPVFMEDVEYEYEIRRSAESIAEGKMAVLGRILERPSHGTIIRVTNLKGGWSPEKVSEVFEECLKLVSPFGKVDFVTDILLNGKSFFTPEEAGKLQDLLEKAPLRMQGVVDPDGHCDYALNGEHGKMSLLEDLSDDRDIRKQFYGDGKIKRNIECGPFEFRFYVYDFARGPSLSSHLQQDEKVLIRSHRTYVYRDGVRVYPYGDPSDDWVGVDIARGTWRAGEYLSNDQMVGYVGITSSGNPNLRDKSSREGLMDIGNAFADLKVLILGILGFLNKELKKLREEKLGIEEKRKREKGLYIKESLVEKDMLAIEKHLSRKQDVKGISFVRRLASEYQTEKKILNERVEIVEDLAGVGMAVDAASHDLMIMLNRAATSLNRLTRMTETDDFDHEGLRENLDILRGQFAFIEDQMNGIQPLFRSSRRRNKNLRIEDIIRKVELYYIDAIQKEGIKVNVEERGAPLIVKCSEGILLQVFINLMDNSVYWLNTIQKQNKRINILIDGTKCQVTFADNGPGVRKGDVPFLFQAFFSTKGIRGRGLGLYIARQLLDRYDFEINYVVAAKKKVLDGANFLVDFGGKEEVEE